MDVSSFYLPVENGALIQLSSSDGRPNYQDVAKALGAPDDSSFVEKYLSGGQTARDEYLFRVDAHGPIAKVVVHVRAEPDFSETGSSALPGACFLYAGRLSVVSSSVPGGAFLDLSFEFLTMPDGSSLTGAKLRDSSFGIYSSTPPILSDFGIRFSGCVVEVVRDVPRLPGAVVVKTPL